MTTRLLALANPQSLYYHNVTAILRRAMADRASADNGRKKVMIPFKVDATSVAEYERRFGWKITVENHGLRSSHTPHVAGLAYCMALRNMLAMGYDGEEVISIDGDLPLIAAKGLSYVKVVRTGSSKRLMAGYALEETQLMRLRNSGNTSVKGAAGALLDDLRCGGGGRVYLDACDTSISCDTVLVDHTRTSMSLKQAVACGSAWRANMVRGVCFFQVEMLMQDSGPLSAFPGEFFIDQVKDTITYVPEDDPGACFSHSWSALRSFFLNHECVYDGQTWLVEKHLSDKGVFHYAAHRAVESWEFATELGANYYSDDLTEWVELEFPTRGGVAEGAGSIYWRRDKVRILKSLYDKTMAVMLSVDPKRLTRDEVLSTMRAYNNTAVVGGDVVRKPMRVFAQDLNAAATPILAQVVCRRASASAECGKALGELRRRYSIANEGVLSLFWEVCCATTSFVSEVSLASAFGQAAELGQLVDGTVNMSVLARAVPKSVEVRQVVGGGVERDCGSLIPGLPGWRPAAVESLLARARNYMRRTVSSVPEEVSSIEVSDQTDTETVSSSQSVEGAYVATHTLFEPAASVEREGVAGKLFDKLVAEQDAATYLRPPRTVTRFEDVGEMPPEIVPTVFSDRAGMQEDYDDGFPGVSVSDAEIVAHVASTEDVELTRTAYMSVNSAKREVAAPRWVRRAKCRAGAAGVLPRTQVGLLAATGKRNVDVPTNRELVDFLEAPGLVVKAIRDNCYVDGWEQILERELNAGLWQPTTEDLSVYVGKVETAKAEAMLREFFSVADVDMRRWLVMTKERSKPPVDPAADTKVPLPQTIMYNESKSMNAMYSSMMSRFHDVLDQLFLPNIRFNDRSSCQDHEVWFNSLQPLRATASVVHRYQGDSYNFDRSQELLSFSVELMFYREHGLNEATLDVWKQTMGVKAAVSLMHGVLMHIVMQGLSGIFKTLMRNGLVTLASVVMATKLRKDMLISLDVKGDDYTLETNRPVDVEYATRVLAWMFNFSAKLWGCEYLYFCSKYWIWLDGWWYWLTDPERKFESLCAAVSVDQQGKTTLSEKWISLRDDLRHYGDGLVVEELARAVQVTNARRVRPPLMLIGGLARLAADRDFFFEFYGPVELVGL